MRYSEDQKADALRLADKIGAKKASKQLLIAYPTILDWRKKREGISEPVMIEELLPASPAVVVPSDESHTLEMQVQLLQQENAQLKTQLARQAMAIHALSPIDN